MAFLTGAADGLVRLFAADVHDVQRRAHGIGDHDRTVRGFAFDLGRARIGVAFGAGDAFGKHFLLQKVNHIAVFGVHHGQGAQFLAARERGEHLVVFDHQRALIGHEVLEAVDAHLHRVFHLGKNVFVPAGDRHVIADVRADLRRGLAVPFLDGVLDRAVSTRQTEVDQHGGAACGGGPCARLEGFSRCGAHKWHLKMCMRVDPAWDHIGPLGVDIFIAFQIRTNFLDRFTFDQNIRHILAIGSYNRAALDDLGHGSHLPVWPVFDLVIRRRGCRWTLSTV